MRCRTVARLLTLLACGLLGCRPAARVPATGAEPPPTGALRLVTVEGGAHREALEALLADFNRSHPGQLIAHESIAGGGAALLGDKVRTSFASGSPPDLFQMWPGEISGPFIDAGRLRPLDDLYAKHGWADAIIPWAVRATERHGRRWGVPTNSHGMTFWYRTDVFARFGLHPPERYDELEAICRVLVSHDVHCLSLGGKYGWQTMRLLDFFLEKTCGPELHDRINDLTTTWDRPEVVEAYALLRRWVDAGWIASGFLTVAPDEAHLPFYRGDAAMVFEGDWLEAQMVRDDEQDIRKYDFFLPPTDREPRRFSAFAEFFVVSDPAPGLARIEAFFDWYLSPAVQERALKQLSWASRRAVPVDAVAQPRMARWRNVLAAHETYRPTDQMFPKELMDSWWAIQDGVVAGQVSPADAARAVEGVMTAYRKRRAANRPAVLDRLASWPMPQGAR